MGKIIGIDLGTTNSEVAFVEAGKPTIIKSAEGQPYFPSVVGHCLSHLECLDRFNRKLDLSTSLASSSSFSLMF